MRPRPMRWLPGGAGHLLHAGAVPRGLRQQEAAAWQLFQRQEKRSVRELNAFRDLPTSLKLGNLLVQRCYMFLSCVSHAISSGFLRMRAQRTLSLEALRFIPHHLEKGRILKKWSGRRTINSTVGITESNFVQPVNQSPIASGRRLSKERRISRALLIAQSENHDRPAYRIILL